MNLSKAAIKHPTLISLSLLALLVFGLIAISGLNTEFLPDLSMPSVIVVTIYPGASSEEVEKNVTNILEENFQTIPGYESMESTSMDSASIVTITFNEKEDPYERLDEVRNRLDEISGELPDGIERPTAMVGGADRLPVFSFIVEGSGEDINALSDYVNAELKPILSRVEGVSEVIINGAREAKVEIKLKTEELEEKGVSAISCYQALSRGNYTIPLDDASYNGRTINAEFDGSFKSLEDIRNLKVGLSKTDLSPIYLKDVADVYFSYDKEDYFVTKDGKEVIEVDIRKRSDGNALAISESVREILKEQEEEKHGSISFSIISDDSNMISSSQAAVIESGILGVIIAVIVIYLFLSDWRATIIIAFSIPLSIFFTFIGMKILGLSVNLMSLSGIVVALGNIVGASILVIDEVYRYYHKRDDNRALYSVDESIIKGSGNVFSSVMGSGLTTIVVFLPIAFLSGFVGKILKDISITFVIALSASLVVALLYIPYFLKKFLKEDGRFKEKRENPVSRCSDYLEKKYEGLIRIILENKAFTLIAIFAILALSLYILPNLDFTFIPSTDNSDFYISLELPDSYDESMTREATEKAEAIMKERVSELETYVVYSGKSMNATSFASKKNEGSIHALLKPVSDRDRSVHEIIMDLQIAISESVPDAKVSVTNGGFDRLISLVSGGGGYGITLSSNNIEDLFEAANIIASELEKDEEVISVSMDSSRDLKSAVIKANYDSLTRLGIPSSEAGLISAIMFYGTDCGTFNREGEIYDIHLSSDISEMDLDINTLSKIKIPTLSVGNIPLISVADLVIEPSISQINHEEGEMTLTVSANLTGESTDGVTRRMNEYLKENPLPKGVEVREGGLGSLVSESMASLKNALLIAAFLVYLVMVGTFERYDQPLLILLLFPFCIVGAALALSIFGDNLSIVSVLGIISLIGMLVNNGIVIADYVNLKRKDLTRLHPHSYTEEIAILKNDVAIAASSRLRAILMSALTTILAVVPMAFASAEGSEIYAPLGEVIMGGLTTATILTLFAMPLYYYLLEAHRIKKRMKREEKDEKV